MSKQESKFSPSSFRECFDFDDSEFNPSPRGLLRKIARLLFAPRYSMTSLMRLTQYISIKSEGGGTIRRWLCVYGVAFLKRLNQVFHNFEHGSNPKIGAGIIFHHTGVCITGKTIIESGVHIYRNAKASRIGGRRLVIICWAIGATAP